MAARTPRRSFATPFVVTLAAIPACYVQSSPGGTGPHGPPPATQTTQTQPTDPHPHPTTQPTQGGPVVVNPPMPGQQQPPQTQPASPPPVAPMSQRWTVYKTNDGCMAAMKAECKPGTMCNPPPPFKYECPANVSLDKPITVALAADGGSCHVEYAAVKCPPNTACNPPRPTPVACPKR